MHLKVILCILLISVAGQASSQQKPALQLGYFGSFITHPGLRSGMEYALYSRDYLRESGNKINHSEVILTPHIGGYYHHQNHTGIFTGFDVGCRHTWHSGLMFEGFLSSDFFHAFFYGPTYKVNNGGEIEKVRFAGKSVWMNSVSIGGGYVLNEKLMWFFRPAFHLKSAINTYHIPGGSLTTGLIINLP